MTSGCLLMEAWKAASLFLSVLGEKLEQNIDRYIKTGSARHSSIDVNKLRDGALPWLRSLHRLTMLALSADFLPRTGGATAPFASG